MPKFALSYLQVTSHTVCRLRGGFAAPCRAGLYVFMVAESTCVRLGHTSKLEPECQPHTRKDRIHGQELLHV